MKPEPLYVDRALILSSLAGTTTHRCSEVVAALDRMLGNAQSAALRGPRNAQSYSAKVRTGIRRAIGPWPANGVRPKVGDVLDWIATKGPEHFGLHCIPDEATVAAVIEKMETEQKAKLLSLGKGSQ